MIKGCQKFSLIDYPGNIVTTVFFGGCNFRCQFCHNKNLVIHYEKLRTITEEEIFYHLVRNRAYLDGVCISGGEPTLYKNLPLFIRKIKQFNLFVKLDTNGTNPKMVKELIRANLIDYVALDIKTTWPKYSQIVGNNINIPNVKNTLNIIKNSLIDYEVRTTVVPALHSKEDIQNVAKSLVGVKRYYLQQFRPFSTLKPRLKGTPTFSKEQLEKLRRCCNKFVPTFVRAKD